MALPSGFYNHGTPPDLQHATAPSFEEKLRRSLVLDDLNPLVTLPIIEMALSQYGSVRSVKIISSPLLDPKSSPMRAVVEMANPREAALAIYEIQERPLMIKYFPRPVMAMPAEATLFPERPSKLRNVGSDMYSKDNKLSCVWVRPGDSDWNMVNQQKRLAKKHVSEALYLSQELRKEEEKLARDQDERAAIYMNKLKLVESYMSDKTWAQLSRWYGLYIAEK